MVSAFQIVKGRAKEFLAKKTDAGSDAAAFVMALTVSESN